MCPGWVLATCPDGQPAILPATYIQSTMPLAFDQAPLAPTMSSKPTASLPSAKRTIVLSPLVRHTCLSTQPYQMACTSKDFRSRSCKSFLSISGLSSLPSSLRCQITLPSLSTPLISCASYRAINANSSKCPHRFSASWPERAWMSRVPPRSVSDGDRSCWYTCIQRLGFPAVAPR